MVELRRFRASSSSTPVFFAAAVLACLFGLLAGYRLINPELLVMAVLWLSVAYLLASKARTPSEPWLPGLMALAMAAKLVGSWVRYYVLEVAYQGSGDAGRYHGFGIEIAETWRAFEIPDLTMVAMGGEGTRFTAWITGLLYAPYEPSKLGGFWVFALLAFLGQFFLYLAFRQTSGPNRWKRYAILIYFWPTLIFWPSSIGKEALILLFLGLGSWAAACLYRRYQIRWLPLIAVSTLLISIVRVHVAALFGVSLLGAIILHRSQNAQTSNLGRRTVILLIGLVLLFPLTAKLGDEFGVNLNPSVGLEELEPVFSRVGDTTAQGGSAVPGGVIQSPLDIPGGITKVLFRPLPFEADNTQMLVASVEGVILLGLILWQLPTIIGNRRVLKHSPYLVFCAIYCSLFIWGWSAILNLGILARQRSLVIPFLLALIAGLGWTRDGNEAHPLKAARTSKAKRGASLARS